MYYIMPHKLYIFKILSNCRKNIELYSYILLICLFFSYSVRDCGMNFEWNLFQFTARDCLLLAKVGVMLLGSSYTVYKDDSNFCPVRRRM